MRGRRGIAAALLTGAAVIAGCTDVSTDPQIPVSLQFDSLPALSVVVGDTVRGDSLEPARLGVRAFNGAGGIVGDSQVRIIGIDSASRSAFRMIDGLKLVGTAQNTSVRLVAQAGSLQSQIQTLAVIEAPTGIVKRSVGRDSIMYDRVDTVNRFIDASVAVVRATGATTRDSINGLRVRFRVVSFSSDLIDSVRLVSPTSGRSITSVLSTSKLATIRVKAYFSKVGLAGQSGSIVLEARTRVLGADVPGSPLRDTVALVPFRLP